MGYDMRSDMICVITTNHSWQDIRVFHKEFQTLLDSGLHTRMATFLPHRVDSDSHFLPIPKPHSGFLRMLISPFFALGKALQNRARVIILHDPECLPMGLCAKILGLKVVYDVHEDYGAAFEMKYYLPPLGRTYGGLIFDRFERYCASKFDLIIAATKRIAEKFSQCNCIIVHNHPLLQAYQTPALSVKPFRLVYPGLISPYRGITELVKALERFDEGEVELLLAGDIRPLSYKAELEQLAGWKRVRYFGVLPFAEVQQLIRNSHLGVECSHPLKNYLESESNKIFEYMANGIPVLCSNLPRIKEIVESSHCGICIPPNSPDAIAEGIRSMMNSPALRKNLGQNGWNAAQGRYCWQVDGKLFQEAIKKLLEEV